MSKLKDITGQKFDYLKVIKYLGYNPKLKGAIWECQCDCGNKHITTGNHLRTGHTYQNNEETFGYEDVCELVAYSNNSINRITNLYLSSKS